MRAADRPAVPAVHSPETLPMALKLAVLALSVAVSLPAQGVTTDLSATEREISEYVRAHVEDGIRLIADQVRIGSGTHDFEGVRRMHELLAPELRELGFHVRWVPQDHVGRAGHLVAERVADDPVGRSVLLIGHLDTVDEDEGWWERDGMTGYGPGANDMKGGNAVIILALRALDEAGALEGRTIRVIFTGDEESPGDPVAEARAVMTELARQSDVALEFETAITGEGFDYGTTARRGASGWLLDVEGRTAHSSGIFSRGTGAGAVFEAARILEAFYEELKGEEYLTFNPAVIVGGSDVEYDPEAVAGSAASKTNIVAGRAVVHGGIRTISDDQLGSARERMREIVARHLPRTSAEIRFREGYPGMPPTPGNRELLGMYDRASRDLGYPEVREFDPGGRGASDLSFAAAHVRLGALGGIGVEGTGAHSPNETVDLGSLAKAAERAALLIHRLR